MSAGARSPQHHQCQVVLGVQGRSEIKLIVGLPPLHCASVGQTDEASTGLRPGSELCAVLEHLVAGREAVPSNLPPRPVPRGSIHRPGGAG